MWTFRADVIGRAASVKGFEVEASDGPCGRVAWASYAPGESYLVVTVRHHLHPTHHIIPAGAVVAADADQQTLKLALSRREVEQAPQHHDPATPVDLSADFLAGLWPTWLHDAHG